MAAGYMFQGKQMEKQLILKQIKTINQTNNSMYTVITGYQLLSDITREQLRNEIGKPGEEFINILKFSIKGYN